MAQLPPKIPSMTQNWPNSFPHQRLATFIMPTSTPPTPTATSTTPATAQHGWADEFLDFASARRGAHRRSISDSIAFLESPLVNMAMDDQEEEYRRGNNNNNFSMHGFERLDEEQLIMSMFCDDMSAAVAAAAASGPPTLSSSNPSSPSDQNSNNDEKQTLMALQHQQPKTEPGEVESPPEGDDPHAPPPPLSAEAASGDTIIDPKRVKRILANRQSAQRSRVRKLQYISELERSVTTLQSEVSALSPRVAFLDHQRLILNVDNSALKQRIAALAQDNIFKDAHQEALKKEIERLRQVYHRQNLNKMGSQNTQPPPSTAVQQNSDDIAMGCTDEERIPN